MLNDSRVIANVPAADLERARRFNAEVLGLTPSSESPDGLVYTTAGGTTFHLYETAYAGQAGHTIAQCHVADVAAEVSELQAKGLEFEHYVIPGVTWDGAVATVEGLGLAAWFTDSEGNVMCIDDAG